MLLLLLFMIPLLLTAIVSYVLMTLIRLVHEHTED